MLGRLVFPTLTAVALLAGCASPPADDAPEVPAPAPTPRATPAPPSPTPSAAPALADVLPTPLAPAEPPAAAPAPALPAGPTELRTAILPGAFEHATIELPAGSTITWTNADSQVHSVVSTDGTFSGSGPLAPGMTFQRTFQSLGEHPLHCRFHEGMTGTIVIV